MALLAGVSKPRLLSGRTTPPECRGIAVDFRRRGSNLVERCPGRTSTVIVRGALHRVSRAAGTVYFEQIRVLKAGASHA